MTDKERRIAELNAEHESFGLHIHPQPACFGIATEIRAIEQEEA